MFLAPSAPYRLLTFHLARRYHKQLGAWFQRHQEPRESTDEYENGDYIYFDYKLSDSGDGWVFRMKKSFVFRYDQLENEVSE